MCQMYILGMTMIYDEKGVRIFLYSMFAYCVVYVRCFLRENTAVRFAIMVYDPTPREGDSGAEVFGVVRPRRGDAVFVELLEIPAHATQIPVRQRKRMHGRVRLPKTSASPYLKIPRRS